MPGVKNTVCMNGQIMSSNINHQRCALAAPRGPRRLTFATGLLENLSFFSIEIICWEPRISQAQSIRGLSAFLTAQP